MSSSYTSSNKFEKPATGEQNGSWGATVDSNYDLLDQALDGYSVISIPSGSTSISLNIANGQSSVARSRVLAFTGAPSGQVTVQIIQNTVPRWWVIINATSQALVFVGAGLNQATVSALSTTFLLSNGVDGTYDLFNLRSHYVGTLKANNSINSPSYTGGTLSLAGAASADSLALTHGVTADTVTANTSITAPVVNATTINVPNLAIGSALSVPSLVSAGDVKAKSITGTTGPQPSYAIGTPGIALGSNGSSALRGSIYTFQLTSSSNGNAGANQALITVNIPALTVDSVVLITPANQRTAELYGTSVPWVQQNPGSGFTFFSGTAGLPVPQQAVGSTWFRWNYLVII